MKGSFLMLKHAANMFIVNRMAAQTYQNNCKGIGSLRSRAHHLSILSSSPVNGCDNAILKHYTKAAILAGLNLGFVSRSSRTQR